MNESATFRPVPGSARYALVDCNNFYGACERVFNPTLRNKPVVVLSNNDGCIIARSEEAKKLGIRMGVPAFQIGELLRKHRVAVFSSNYALYGDLSMRVMNTLSAFTPSLEIYSIDEAFLDLSGICTAPVEEYAAMIRNRVLRSTGIPVSIGIGPTKTLAKLANHRAKQLGLPVFHPGNGEGMSKLLAETGVEELWGIGKQYAKRLAAERIVTALDFVNTPDAWIRKNLTVNGLRTKQELLGVACLELEEIPGNRKGICTSRSFGEPQSAPEPLEEAVATFASRCAEKLRRQKSAASQLMVFIHTNGFRPDLPQYARNRVVTLPVPTNSSIDLVKHAVEALHALYAPGYQYKKAGVMVSGLVPEKQLQQNLFTVQEQEKKARLMASVDAVNRKLGNDAVRIATRGSGRKWKLRQEKRSPRYTTRWDELMEIRAGMETRRTQCEG